MRRKNITINAKLNPVEADLAARALERAGYPDVAAKIYAARSKALSLRLWELLASDLRQGHYKLAIGRLKSWRKIRAEYT